MGLGLTSLLDVVIYFPNMYMYVRGKIKIINGKRYLEYSELEVTNRVAT